MNVLKQLGNNVNIVKTDMWTGIGKWHHSQSRRRKKAYERREITKLYRKPCGKYLNSKGRNIIGWDEILEGGLAPNATVMSWRGVEGGMTAAKAGHDAIMTPNPYAYLDHYQEEPEIAPVTIGGYNTLKRHTAIILYRLMQTVW